MIPEEEWTNNQREFVGSQFDTPKGGVLTVVGVAKDKMGSHSLFLCKCSICSKDKELFPDNFKITKGSLRRGSLPCGCTKTNNLTKEQNLIIINRFLKENNPTLTAVNIEKSTTGYNVEVVCPICSEDKELWPNPIITDKWNILNGKIPCGCAKVAGKRTDQQDLILMDRYLKNIKSNLTVNEVLGYQNKTNRSFVFTCGICSKDEELWPYGSIVSTRGQIVAGHTPCGCTKTPRWSERQNKIRVKRECTSRGYLFHGWNGEYNGKETLVSLENPVTGNKWVTTNIHHFLMGGGDPSLNSGGGFDRTKPAMIYLTRFYDCDTPVVIKYGISNKITKERMSRQERYSGLKGKTVYTHYSKNGEFIEGLEKKLGKIIKLQRVDKEVLPDGFTEAVYYKPFVEKFIINYLDMLTQNLGK